ncbi:MAG: metallopeptidase family protein [Gemmatimonadota bacterium]|nr:metallopeptidase family protein [Gemmatimonadota bacterium]
MRFEDFERHAREAFEEIPEQYREGIDGLTVRRERLVHPTLPEVFTLGHCLTEEHLSDYAGPDTMRSMIALYWGSFRELAARDPDFDWEGELWETLTHELRHHLESLAGDDALEDVDYAADELFKRQEGLVFDPWYYQSGEDYGGGAFAVEGTHYLEQVWDEEDFERAEAIDFDWRGSRYRIRRPAELGDVHLVRVHGEGLHDESLELVLLRKRGWWEGLKGLVASSGGATVLESEVEAERKNS